MTFRMTARVLAMALAGLATSARPPLNLLRSLQEERLANRRPQPLRSACGTFPTVVWPVRPDRTFTIEAETHGCPLLVMNRRQMRLAKSRTTRCSNGT